MNCTTKGGFSPRSITISSLRRQPPRKSKRIRRETHVGVGFPPEHVSVQLIGRVKGPLSPQRVLCPKSHDFCFLAFQGPFDLTRLVDVPDMNVDFHRKVGSVTHFLGVSTGPRQVRSCLLYIHCSVTGKGVRTSGECPTRSKDFALRIHRSRKHEGSFVQGDSGPGRFRTSSRPSTNFLGCHVVRPKFQRSLQLTWTEMTCTLSKGSLDGQ